MTRRRRGTLGLSIVDAAIFSLVSFAVAFVAGYSTAVMIG